MVNIKRAVLSGALAWVLIFFEVSILMFGFKLQPSGMTYYIIHYILLIFIVAVCASIYFNGTKTKTGLKEGILAGVVMFASGMVLDAIITVPLFVKDYVLFFGNIWMILGYVEGIVVAAIVGVIKK